VDADLISTIGLVFGIFGAGFLISEVRYSHRREDLDIKLRKHENKWRFMDDIAPKEVSEARKQEEHRILEAFTQRHLEIRKRLRTWGLSLLIVGFTFQTIGIWID